MAWRRTFGAAVALLLLLAPGAATAASVEGTLSVESGALFPREARITLGSAILMAPESNATFSLEAEAPVVHVRLHEQRRVGLPGYGSVGVSSHMDAWTLTDVVLSSLPTPPEDDTVMLEPGTGATLSIVPAAAIELLHSRETELNSDGRFHSASGPNEPFYLRHVRGSHLRLDTAGLVQVEGNVLLRVQGPDLDLWAAQNRTTLATGTEARGPHEVVERWAFLYLERARLTFSSPVTPVVAVGTVADVAWTGRAAMVAREGALHARDAVYSGAGPVVLDGTMTARVTPEGGSSGLLLDDVRGDLAATTLMAVAKPVSPAGPAAALVLGLVAGAALVSAGGVAAVLLRRRRRLAPRPIPLRPSEAYQLCLDWADFFERNDDPAGALECLRAARAYAEEDEHLVVLWEATCQERLGNLDEALERYEAAVVLAAKGDSEAAFAAAMVAGQLGRQDAALTNLRLALMADPQLLDTVEALLEDDDPFRGLRAHPEFKRLLRDARAWARTYED